MARRVAHMTVRPITPLVPARTGGVQIYADADHYDRWADDLAAGDPYDPEHLCPGRPSEQPLPERAGLP